MDPAEFYTGIVAEVFAAVRSTHFDASRYEAFLEAHGQPALELGCGDDGPFFDLVAAGYDVTGLDSSADMVRRGRERLQREGLDADIHHGTMEDFALGTRFASIYLAGPTFNLLPDDAAAARSLQAIARHLRPDGAALIPLWVPPPTPPESMGTPRIADTGQGEARYTVTGETYDVERRTRITHSRYELLTPEETRAEDRDWIIHWFTEDVFRELAAAAGLDATFRQLDEEQSEATLRPAVRS